VAAENPTSDGEGAQLAGEGEHAQLAATATDRGCW
jgi:hypothetical protein